MRERFGDQLASGSPGWRWVWTSAGIGALAYMSSLIATAPAQVLSRVVDVPPAMQTLSGKLWNGRATLEGGLQVGWQISPWRSLVGMAIHMDWDLRAPDTQLEGHVRISRSDVAVRDVKGVAGWRLVDAVLPGLPFRCDPTARVDVSEAGFSRTTYTVEIVAAGSLLTGPGACMDDKGTTNIPALRGEAATVAGDLSIKVRPRDDPATELGTILLKRTGTLVVTVQPAGARLVPGLPSSAPTVIEMPGMLKGLTSPVR